MDYLPKDCFAFGGSSSTCSCCRSRCACPHPQASQKKQACISQAQNWPRPRPKINQKQLAKKLLKEEKAAKARRGRLAAGCEAAATRKQSGCGRLATSGAATLELCRAQVEKSTGAAAASKVARTSNKPCRKVSSSPRLRLTTSGRLRAFAPTSQRLHGRPSDLPGRTQEASAGPKRREKASCAAKSKAENVKKAPGPHPQGKPKEASLHFAGAGAGQGQGRRSIVLSFWPSGRQATRPAWCRRESCRGPAPPKGPQRKPGAGEC